MSTMKNMPIADLRTINTVEAAKAIEEMHNIAVLILPEDADPEVMNAIHAIPKKNVATVLTLPKDAKVKQMNGQSELTPAVLKQEGILLVNGQTIVTGTCNECKSNLIVNGQIIYPKNCPITLTSCSGQAMSFDYETYVNFNDDMMIDADMMELMECKTLFLCNGDIRFAKDITVDMLKEKLPCFLFNGDVVVFDKKVAAYLKLHSTINGDLKVRGIQFDADEDDCDNTKIKGIQFCDNDDDDEDDED